MAEGAFTSPPPPGRERLLWAVSTVAAFVSVATSSLVFWWMSDVQSWFWRVVEALYSGAELLLLHVPEESLPLLHDPNPGWQGIALHLARLSAIIALLFTGIALVVQFFGQELLRTFARGHVVICGLGDVGLRLAIRAPRRFMKPIIAIEKSCPPPVHELLQHHGVILIDGDATEEKQLKTAKVHRAELVIATCSDDQTNLAVAATVRQILASSNANNRPVVCRTLIRDPATRVLLSRQGFFRDNPSRYQVNYGDLDRHAVAARLALKTHPLDFQPIREQDDTEVHLVVIGFGTAGQSLALHAAEIGHFANEVDQHGRTKRQLRLTVVDSTDEVLAEFTARHSKLDQIIAVDTANFPTKPDFVSRLAALCPPQTQSAASALVTFAFCWEDQTSDERNFRFGTELAQCTKDRAAQTLIYQDSRKGFAALLEDGAGADVRGRIHPFGMVEDVFNWDALVHEEQDMLAKALHDSYRRKRLEAGESVEAHAPWNDLGDELKDSNRQAADHIPVKLRALGYHHERLREGQPRIAHFTYSEIELLSRMEHARWCAERFLGGWSHGETTDRAKRVNKCLVEWGKLPPEEQMKDPEQIQAISEVLFNLGYGIYR